MRSAVCPGIKDSTMCRLQHVASNTVRSQDIGNGKRVDTVPGCHASESGFVSQHPVARFAKLLSG